MSGTGVGGADVDGAGMSGTRRRAHTVGAPPTGVAGCAARRSARATAVHRDRGRPPGGLVE